MIYVVSSGIIFLFAKNTKLLKCSAIVDSVVNVEIFQYDRLFLKTSLQLLKYRVF